MGEITVLSASQVDTFRMCSLKWRFRYIEKAEPEIRSAALVVGSVVDTAIKAGLHQIRHAEVRLEELNPEQILADAWEAEVASTTVPILWGKKGEGAARATAQSLVTGYLSREDLQDLAGRLELDVRFELPLLDQDLGVHLPEVVIVGILDAVERLPDGRLRPLDWKTASSRANYTSGLEHHLQGSLYCWALRQLHGDVASSAMRFDVGLKLKEPRWEAFEVELGPVAQRRALGTVHAVYEAMKAGWAFPEPGFMCGGCSYRRRCLEWTGLTLSESPVDVFAALLT